MRESEKALKRLANDYLWQRISKTPKPWLDVGCGDCPIPGADPFDKHQGDAETLLGIQSETYNLIWSSHCLEHVGDWIGALQRWMDVLKPNGYLWILVPDWKLYEHEVWPSKFNPDHKHHFSIGDLSRYAERTYTRLLRLQVVDSGYDYSLPDSVDQTLGGAEACIEMVLQKL